MKLSDLINTIKNNIAQQQKGPSSYFTRQSPILANILSEFKSITSFLSANNKQLRSISKKDRSVNRPSFSGRVGSSLRRVFAPLVRRSRSQQVQPLGAQTAGKFLSQPQQTLTPSFAPPLTFQPQPDQQTAQEQQPTPQPPIDVNSVLKAAALIAAANAIKQTDFQVLVGTILKRIGFTSDIADEIEEKALKTKEELKEGIEQADKETKTPTPQPIPTPGGQPPTTPGQPTPAPVQPKSTQQPSQTQKLPRPPAVQKPSISSSTPASSSTVDFIRQKEGKYFEKATWDNIAYGIGYGHLIRPEEIKQGYIDVGGGDRVAVSGEGGRNTTITKEQAEKLLVKDIKVYEDKAAASLGDTWNKLNDSQKAALTSYAYNTGGINDLIKAGLKDAIVAGDTEKAAKIIESGIKTASGKYSAGLAGRRREEADLFRSGNKAQTPKQAEKNSSQKNKPLNKPSISSTSTGNSQQIDQSRKTNNKAQPIQVMDAKQLVPQLQKEQVSSLESPEYRGPSLNDRSGQVAFNQQINEEPSPIINLVDNSVYTTERKKTAPQIDSPSAIYSKLT